MADTKISALSTLTKSTVASNDSLPIVDTSASATKQITYQELMQPQDDQFAIADNGDNTKKVAFQVSGVTTGTTRTLTVPDANTTIVGTDTTVTLSNKTLGSGTKVSIGSDAAGDIYYRDGSGNLTRLAIGTAGQILDVSAGGIPEWIANPSISDASTTVKGSVEIATTAEITSGTSTGGTGAILVVPASAVGSAGASKLVQFNSSGQYPSADGSLITGISLAETTMRNIVNNVPTNTSVYHTYQAMPYIYHDGATYRAAGFLTTYTPTADTQGGAGSMLLSNSAGSGAYMISFVPSFKNGTYQESATFADIGTSALYAKFRVQIRGTGTSPTYGFGFTEAGGVIYNVYNSTANDTARFVYDGTTMRATSSRSGGVTNTTVSVTVTNWNLYEIVVTSSQNLFYVNGVLVATHTTNLPNSANGMHIGWGQTSSVSSAEMYISPIIISIPNS